MPELPLDFSAATNVRALTPGLFSWTIQDGWQQGRGAFGGVVLGAMVRAIRASEPESDRALRSFTAEIAGPVATGDATIEVRELRRGSGVAVWIASIEQGGVALATATAVLGKARFQADPTSIAALIPAPTHARSWNDVPVTPIGPPLGPTFAKQLEFRETGPLPATGSTTGEVTGWVRLAVPTSTLDDAAIVALADAHWSTALVMERTMRPMSTVAFTLQRLSTRAPLDPKSPLFHRARALASDGGYVVEHRELWSPEGELVALNQQTFVVIR